jgi:hypothetical protein
MKCIYIPTYPPTYLHIYVATVNKLLPINICKYIIINFQNFGHLTYITNSTYYNIKCKDDISSKRLLVCANKLIQITLSVRSGLCFTFLGQTLI